jgi:hypothetical protein
VTSTSAPALACSTLMSENRSPLGVSIQIRPPPPPQQRLSWCESGSSPAPGRARLQHLAGLVVDAVVAAQVAGIVIGDPLAEVALELRRPSSMSWNRNWAM